MTNEQRELITTMPQGDYDYSAIVKAVDPTRAEGKPSAEQQQRDAGYHKAQLLLQSLLNSGLISLSEYNKITLLNRQTFSPYLYEIMPNITG